MGEAAANLAIDARHGVLRPVQERQRASRFNSESHDSSSYSFKLLTRLVAEYLARCGINSQRNSVDFEPLSSVIQCAASAHPNLSAHCCAPGNRSCVQYSNVVIRIYLSCVVLVLTSIAGTTTISCGSPMLRIDR
jgi:hypothetical protein